MSTVVIFSATVFSSAKRYRSIKYSYITIVKSSGNNKID